MTFGLPVNQRRNDMAKKPAPKPSAAKKVTSLSPMQNDWEQARADARVSKAKPKDKKK